jgi:hypothetical protein
MGKQLVSKDAPQSALTESKSIGGRRHRRKADIRQRVIDERRQEGSREKTAVPSTIPDGPNLDRMTVGLDRGDKKSNYCILDPHGKIADEGSLATNRASMSRFFDKRPQARVALEASTHSS